MRPISNFKLTIFGLVALILLATSAFVTSCVLPSTSGAVATSASPIEPHSPLATPTLQPTPLPTPTPTCNPPWPTPPSEACPWLPSPTPEPTFPPPTPFVVPTAAQTPTPLPLPQPATGPAGRLLYRTKMQLQDGSSALVFMAGQVDAEGSINQPFQRLFLQAPADMGLPEDYDYSMWFDRYIPSPDGKLLAGIYADMGEVVSVFDLTTLKTTLPGSGSLHWVNSDGQSVAAVGKFYGWHPNGYEFLFWEDNAPDRGLWLVNAPTGEHRLLVQPPIAAGYFLGAAISPDGQVLVYCDDRIWIANADGSEPRQVLDSAAAVFAWSPDGRYLLYGEYPHGGNKAGTPPPLPHLWLMNREGQSERSLNLSWEQGITFAAHQQPVWSPTGRYVAHSSPLDPGFSYWREKGEDHRGDPLYAFENAGVYVEDVETGEMWLAAENALDPTWSPDGSLLVVAKMDEDEQVDIWIVNIGDRSLRQITDTPELDRYPIWLRSQ
jgi:Tol biopolymer transport system component